MSAQYFKIIVVVQSVSGDDPLFAALESLTEKFPQHVVTRTPLHDSDEVMSMVGLVEDISRAAYVIVQEPLRELRAEHITAAAAARACDTPLLLVSPAGVAITKLMGISDAAPSQVVFYPTGREDAAGWEKLKKSLEIKRREIERVLARADREQYLRPIISNLSRAAATLDEAAPPQDVALTIARIIDVHTSSIDLTNHVDFIQLDFPVNLYPELLSQLTTTFSSVRTIADPVAEQLPWSNPVDRRSLVTVTERIFAIDEKHAMQFGLESPLAQLHLALQAGGGVSVFRMTEPLRSRMLRDSPVNQRLKGINRFYAGGNIVGGYADEVGENIRLLAFHDTGSIESAYASEMELLAEVDRIKKIAPQDRAQDLTALASWVYSNVLPTPRLDSIYEHGSSAYADDYDGNIVRVTPGYYSQLDVLAEDAKRALVALYAPYSDRDRQGIKVLELGIGTGAFTGRLMRTCAEFLVQMSNESARMGRPFIELDGWDSNSRMVEISSQRLADAARQPADRMIRPNLKEFEFDPSGVPAAGDKYDLVVGSFFSHYWMDARPNREVNRSAELQSFRIFLDSISRSLLNPGGLALFLDAFYTPGRRDSEQRTWRDYVANELGSSAVADTYLNRNSWQFYAPTIDLVQEVATQCRLKVWWRDCLPGYPFKIMVLAAPIAATGEIDEPQ